MTAIALEPVAFVRGGRTEAADDHWGGVRAAIEIDPRRFTPEALQGLESFSHLVVVYQFHGVAEAEVELKARHPRNNAAWPAMGIFAQRGRGRPNRIGVSVCRIVRVDGLRIEVEGLDAIDGSPVLDIKPYMRGFEARGEVREPEWAREIMAQYW